jgi:hypothetical protein
MKIAEYYRGDWGCLMVFLRVCLTITVFSVVFLTEQSAEGIKPMAPLEVTLELGGVPQVGGEVPVLLKVRSLFDAPLVKIRCMLPNGVEIVSGQDTWEGELTAGSLKEMTIILRVKESGQHVVRALATIEYPGGSKVGKGAALLIKLGTESEQKVRPDKKRPLTIRKGKDGQDIADFPLE